MLRVGNRSLARSANTTLLLIILPHYSNGETLMFSDLKAKITREITVTLTNKQRLAHLLKKSYQTAVLLVKTYTFQPPVPRRPWIFILNATCPQANKKFIRDKMNGDCLIININVPANVKEKKLPVFVFVHGGAFRFLSGRSDTLYGPQLISKRGVIFVTMNFRLFQHALLLNDVQDEIIKYTIFLGWDR